MRVQELLGFLLFALNVVVVVVVGNIMLTSRSLRGWYVRLLANVVQIAYAYSISSPSHEVNCNCGRLS